MKRSQSEIGERHMRLLRLMEGTPGVRVSDAARWLGVSPATVRRDFQDLESRGVIRRTHGGGGLAGNPVNLAAPPKDQYGVIRRRKRQIARVAADMVQDGSTLFLNAGTTTLEVIHQIMTRPVRIVTNNAVVTAIWKGGVGELICTGGEYSESTHSFVGELATSVVNRMAGDAVILGANGVCARRGATTHDYREALINAAMLRRGGQRKIIVADGTKIGKAYCFTTGSTADFDCLITDSSADPVELEQMRASGLVVILADSEE